ncbi:MAG: ubiquinol-cytochrome c reductase iron-sulfur subunit [Pirellulales bacterium]
MAKNHNKDKDRGKKPEPEPTTPPPSGDRRDFVTKAAAVAAGTVCGVLPAAAGIYTYLDPLRSHNHPSPAGEDAGSNTADASAGPGRWLKIAAVADVPVGGEPKSFAAITDSWDAWNYHPPHPVGAVFLRWPEGADKPIAFTATCPHLGCFVDYVKSKQSFSCPCHNSEFNLDGAMVKGPPPRGLDELQVEVRGPEIWVRFEKFRVGHEEKMPV